MARDESIASNDASSAEKKKTRRPANTAFRQQRLKAWQPILTPKTVIPLFFAIGIIFAPIGGLLMWANSQVQELVLDYTDCATDAPLTNATKDFNFMPRGTVSHSFKSSNSSTNITAKWGRTTTDYHFAGGGIVNTTVCTLMFNLPSDLSPPVLMYYRLTNFYQNHRRYVQSQDAQQLAGSNRSPSAISGSECSPLTVNDDGKAYYPCGLIANSIFNDTIHSPVWLNPKGSSLSSQEYYMTESGIAWSSDADLYKNWTHGYEKIAPPPDWELQWPYGYNDTYPPPNLHTWEAFHVWMRTAGLPTFSKLARRNDSTTMGSGTYKIQINTHFPVTKYGGTKSLVLSTRTVMGGKNSFLGIAYVVVGGLCILLGTVFTVAHMVKPRKLGDHTYLTWNNADPAPATATATTGPTAVTATGREIRPGTGIA